MSDENLFEELAETRRKIWQKAGGTVDGFFDYCHRYAQEDHARFLAEMEREKAEGKAHAEAQRGGGAEGVWSPVDGEEMVVCEGDVPKYGAGKDEDFARKGAEGDAE